MMAKKQMPIGMNDWQKGKECLADIERPIGKNDWQQAYHSSINSIVKTL